MLDVNNIEGRFKRVFLDFCFLQNVPLVFLLSIIILFVEEETRELAQILFFYALHNMQRIYNILV